MKSPKYFGIVLGVALIGLGYQNCGEQYMLPEEGDLSITSVEDAAPFAYKTSFDQISYMSCRQGAGSFAGNVADKNAFFTFRMGAYGAGSGVKISDDTYSYADSIYDPPYGSNVPDGQATPEQMIEMLQMSPKNRNAQLQVAIRSIRNSRVEVVSTQSNTMIAGQDYADILAPLTTTKLAAEMTSAQRGQWFNTFRSGTGIAGRNIEASLYFFNTNEASFYSTIRNDNLLAATFTMDKDLVKGKNSEVIARGPDDEDMSRSYGTGYKLGFRYGDTIDSAAPTRVLSSVLEMDLDTKQVNAAAQFQCPGELRFVIVHPTNRATACPPEDLDALSANQRAIRNVARRHLSPAYWDINIVQQCAVPKTGMGTCYNVDPGVRKINYRPTVSGGNCSETDPTKPACAHYVSMCLRQ